MIIWMSVEPSKSKLLDIYYLLYRNFGPQHWWPGEGPFEVMVGAILTQSASWKNVEKAILRLKENNALSSAALRAMAPELLAELVRPSGYYHAKARKLKAMAGWLQEAYGDSLEKMSATRWPMLRKQLLEVHGIGPETADSILLYAANKPVFVIDAYARRIVDRLGISVEGKRYQDYQALFMQILPQSSRLFNEYHALLVALGKELCRKSRPRCQMCPLRNICLFPRQHLS